MMKNLTLIGFISGFIFLACSFVSDHEKKVQKTDDVGSWDKLMLTASSSGKKSWQPMLKYLAELHKKSTHPEAWPFDYEWEEIGPGYHLSPAFGHWDIIHQTLDVMQSYPQHALYQLLNDIKNQEPNGLIPGCIWLPGRSSGRKEATWSKSDEGHPPVWVVAIQDYMDQTGDKSHLKDFFIALARQITWFENSRNAEGEGFYYNDILLKKWESGVDEGIRFDKTGMGKWACIDATCHVYQLYHFAAIWAVKDRSLRNIAFENLWPLITGAAPNVQAGKLIDLFILNTDGFLTQHPVSTVGRKDPKFELRMWRGPAWNSMTYWVARGCLRYGRKDAAKILLERALDDSARQFEVTGTIWEFYHPDGGDQSLVKRKPQTKLNIPCKDYLGHNPLIAMAIMYDSVK